MAAFKGFAALSQNLLSGEAFASIEAELESAVHDKQELGGGGSRSVSPRPPSSASDAAVTAAAILTVAASARHCGSSARRHPGGGACKVLQVQNR